MIGPGTGGPAMKLRSTALVIMAAMMLSSPAAANETLVLEPTSPWELDYAEDSCALRRLFGEGDRQTQLEMKRFQPGPELQTTVASKVKMSKQPIRFRFGEEREWEEEYPLFAQFGDELQGVIFTRSLHHTSPGEDSEREGATGAYLKTAPALEAEAAARIDALTLSGAFEHDLVLRTGPLEAPVEALNKCIDDLLTHWDLDVEAHKTRTRSAGPTNLERRQLVEPPARRLGHWGPARVRLAIVETGQVTQCHIQLPPGDPPSEERGCARIRNEFDFEPALDKDGRPMKSYYVTSLGPTVTVMEVRVQSTRPTD
jgi:hypothetical protein